MLNRRWPFIGFCGLSIASSAYAQAPASAQVWQVRYVIDRYGIDAGGNEVLIEPDNPSAVRVDITMQGRVGIRPNSSPSGVANFGVSRIGGSAGGANPFRLQVRDAAAEAEDRNQGRLARGLTGEIRPLNAAGEFDPAGVPTLLRDPSGQPLAGAFAPFRGPLLGAEASPIHVGRNDDNANNGSFANPAAGRPSVGSIVASRIIFVGAEGTTGGLGVAQLDAQGAIVGGDFASFYRLSYFPQVGLDRPIELITSNLSVRYLHAITGSFGVAAPALNLTIPNVTFRVPAPGPTTLLLPGLAILTARRRRAASPT